MTASGIDLRLDFETGDTSQFSGLECPDPRSQLEVYGDGSGYPSPRQGRYAARFSETARDVWAGNGLVRCLAARYDTGESAGDDYYYAFSVAVPASGLGDNLLWELHHPGSLYRLPGCGVAPLALIAKSGGLRFRIATGNCTVGSGYSYWDPDISIPGLAAAPRATWVDLVVHVTFSESDGSVEVWHRSGAGPFPLAPQLARHGIPTLPYADSAGVRGVSLYTELGLYTGSTAYSGSDTRLSRRVPARDVAGRGSRRVPERRCTGGCLAGRRRGRRFEQRSTRRGRHRGRDAYVPARFVCCRRSCRASRVVRR